MANSKDFDQRILNLFDGYVHGTLSRRQFIDKAAAFTAAGVSAATVFASLSPNYALAEQVSPDDKSIVTGYKKYASPQGAGEMSGYYARPAVFEHKLPGVVVVHENRGLNPYIEDVARRLAVAGFIAFAPDALAPLGGYPGNDDEGRSMQQKRDGDEMVEDFVAAVSYLQEHPDCNGSVGAVGFCFGGGMVMRLGVRIPSLAASVPFYGRHPAPDEAASIKAALMLHHAGLDDRVNASWPEYEEDLKAAKVDYVMHLYPQCNHGFHNDSTGRYDAENAKLAWDRTIAFFRKHLS